VVAPVAHAARDPGRKPHLRRPRGASPGLSLGSAGLPPPGPDDHVRGDGSLVVIEYADFECPYCAQTDALLSPLPLVRVFRHFPVVSKHPRARVLAQAAEAAALQGAFWEMHDSLFADQGRLDPPHVWERVRVLGLDLERFEQDRRTAATTDRVERDFRAGLRAGVMSTPTLFVDGEAFAGVPGPELLARLGG
jgi:protein-disulfide isomerase